MPDQKLSSLTAASALAGTELFYADDGTNDVKVTANQIKTYCSGSGGLTVGTSTITSGSSGRVLYDNAGVVGELAVTGSGNAVLATSPTLTTPTIGAATATSINKVAITAPATSATLTIADGKTLTVSNTIAFTATDGSTLAIGTGGTLGTAAYVNTGTSGGTVPLLNAANTWSANQHIASANSLDWNSDMVLSRFGTGILGLSDSTSASTFQAYNTTDSTTSPTNYERGVFGWGVNSNILTIGTQKGGTGSTRNVEVIVGGTRKLDYGITNANSWNMILGTLTDLIAGLNITGTLPVSTTGVAAGVLATITSAGSANNAQQAMNIVLAAGYTGGSQTATARFDNNAAGTGTSFHLGTNNNAFMGVTSVTTAGTNIGGRNYAGGGNVNIGLFGQAPTNKDNATNIGLVAHGLNGGASPVQIGAYIALRNDSTLPSTSAALIADNVAQSAPVFLARVNGTTKFQVDANANVVVGSAAIATNATDGFLYIPTCAGTPTGTPTSYSGMVAMVYDTTNHKLYIYDGGWKGGTAPGAWS